MRFLFEPVTISRWQLWLAGALAIEANIRAIAFAYRALNT